MGRPVPCVGMTSPRREDALSLLAGERVFYGYWPTTRHIPNLARNLRLCVENRPWLKPRVIITTGAGVAVPFAWLGRLFGAKVVYIESLTRIAEPSLSCRLIGPVADRIYVQWPASARSRRPADAGRVVGLPYLRHHRYARPAVLTGCPGRRALRHGRADPRPAGPVDGQPLERTCVEYFSLEETEEQVQTARLIVTHGGVGSILLCLQTEAPPRGAQARAVR